MWPHSSLALDAVATRQVPSRWHAWLALALFLFSFAPLSRIIPRDKEVCMAAKKPAKGGCKTKRAPCKKAK